MKMEFIFWFFYLVRKSFTGKLAGKRLQRARQRALAKIAAFGLLSVISMSIFLTSLAGEANAQGPIRVACVGDSITQYSGYPADLQALLGENYTVGNFGVSGSAVSLQADKPYMRQPAFWEALDSQPDIIVIMLGTNDANVQTYQDVNNFSTNYAKLISQFLLLPGDQKIVIVEPPPILENNLNLTETNLYSGIIPQIEKVANDLSLPTVNVHTALGNYTEYFGDGVHPNGEGANLIANQISSAITSMFDGSNG
jgi:acyl-CoA thioesterase I